MLKFKEAKQVFHTAPIFVMHRILKLIKTAVRPVKPTF